YLGDQMKTVTSSNWQYFFSYVAHERRDTQPGVAHADEIAFVMRTLDTELDAPTDKDREISRLVSDYWVQFARTGNPNRRGLPEWPAYTGDHPVVMEFGETAKLHTNHLPERMEYHERRGIANLEKARDR
ncbi:MAG: carboxylesterase family protein, partial [Gammaproteobacteria bacterium]